MLWHEWAKFRHDLKTAYFAQIIHGCWAAVAIVRSNAGGKDHIFHINPWPIVGLIIDSFYYTKHYMLNIPIILSDANMDSQLHQYPRIGCNHLSLPELLRLYNERWIWMTCPMTQEKFMWTRIYKQNSIIHHINIDLFCSRKDHMLCMPLVPSDISLKRFQDVYITWRCYVFVWNTTALWIISHEIIQVKHVQKKRNLPL